MEDVVSAAVFRGRSVLLTGHTGFKGGWLALWLHRAGAAVHGYALDPSTTPALFDAARVGSALASDVRADLADRERLDAAIAKAAPEIVFHLAAQPLVRESYRDPIATFAANVMGTAHVLEAVRKTPSVRAVVVVTTDKVYENLESMRAYVENDALGGHDPYSASKAAAEIVTASYTKSFFGTANAARIATVRAGNVIGGGDWSPDRLVPDCLRAFAAREHVSLRFPKSMRPWQHVLEPLAGYLAVGARLLDGGDAAAKAASAWNFGPDADDDAEVGDVASRIAALWGDGARVVHQPSDANPHEAGLLRLDSAKAREVLGWKPRWRLARALAETVGWQRAFLDGSDMNAVTLAQVAAYEAGT